jgi:hypothetical protein
MQKKLMNSLMGFSTTEVGCCQGDGDVDTLRQGRKQKQGEGSPAFSRLYEK